MTADGFGDPQLVSPPAADIRGAIASTEQAIDALTDSERFEEIAVVCLQEWAPSLRRSGGPGDEQRDGIGGSLRVDDDELVVTASLQMPWGTKIEGDLAGLAKHGHKPKVVWATTSHTRCGAARRSELQKLARDTYDLTLKIFDGHFLALRLLQTDLLPARQELLGLAPPTFPITRGAQQFDDTLVKLGAPQQLLGRDNDLDRLVVALQDTPCVWLIGAGGVGKSRLALAAAERINIGRVRFLDAATPLDSDRLHTEVAGGDSLVLVVDNAHRREDLPALVSVLLRRTGPTRLLLIARPGFDARLRAALADTAMASPAGSVRVGLEPMSNSAIGELVRAAHPALALSGAIEQIVDLAEGNPQIALIAHEVAVNNGGLTLFSRDGALESYANSAVDSLARDRSDLHADDLRDCLGLTALLGSVGSGEDGLLADALGLSVRQVRQRLNDLADLGLIRQESSRMLVAPDLLAAHLLRGAFFGTHRPTVSLPQVWNAADTDQRQRICAALGGLAGFTLNDHDGAIAFLSSELQSVARASPATGLRWAQSLAPGVADVALACVDTVLDGLAASDDNIVALCRTAMAVCARVGDFVAGWPRQLAIAQTFYAYAVPDDGEAEIREGLTKVYQRLPIAVSEQDGLIAAAVQQSLIAQTTEYADAHGTELGGAQTVALAARQLLTVQFERNYPSPEDDMQVQMRSGILPGSELTARLLDAGVHLLSGALPQLSQSEQLIALEPLQSLHAYAAGANGPWGTRPDPRLPDVCRTALDTAATLFASADQLSIVVRSAVVDALDYSPWPDDQDLLDYRQLFVYDHSARGTEEARAEQIAHALLKSPDLTPVLTRWGQWLAQADGAKLRHSGLYLIETALYVASEEDPHRLRQALEVDLRRDDGLGRLWGGPLYVLISAGVVGQPLISELLSVATPTALPAIALGLGAVEDQWADELLTQLAHSPDEAVRQAVVRAAGWGQPASPARIEAGVHSCLPDDVASLNTLLTGLTREGRELTLPPASVACVRDIVLSAATDPHPEGQTLSEIIGMSQMPRLAIDFLLARLDWFGSKPDGTHPALLGHDRLPEELREPARRGAQPADIDAVLDRLQRGELARSSPGLASDVLIWIDPGDQLSDRLTQWLQADDPELIGIAERVLRETRDPAAFRARVARILQVAPELVITETVLDARDPIWMVGSEKALMLARAAEFAAWIDATEPRLAAIGRAGHDRYAERARSASGEEDDPAARAG